VNIIHILPEFDEGGVERHVLWLSNELAALGHDVTVVSAGGKLEARLKGVTIVHLPVHRKNPLTALYSAVRIARIAKREKTDILHAHSRVPAWIAWWASRLSRKPFVLTAHDVYRLNRALVPFSRTDCVICVSETVRSHLLSVIRGPSRTILNGLQPLDFSWEKRECREAVVRFLFVGRLTKRKGLHIVLEALGKLSRNDWTLDVVGDGPQRAELEEQAQQLSLTDKVLFHGFQDNPDVWMSKCSCFLFPSLEEGMGLTLMRAVQMGVPALASDIPPVRELLLNSTLPLIPPTVSEWRKVLSRVVSEKKGFLFPSFSKEKILSTQEMTRKVLDCYYAVLRNNEERTGVTE